MAKTIAKGFTALALAFAAVMLALAAMSVPAYADEVDELDAAAAFQTVDAEGLAEETALEVVADAADATEEKPAQAAFTATIAYGGAEFSFPVGETRTMGEIFAVFGIGDGCSITFDDPRLVVSEDGMAVTATGEEDFTAQALVQEPADSESAEAEEPAAAEDATENEEPADDGDTENPAEGDDPEKASEDNHGHVTVEVGDMSFRLGDTVELSVILGQFGITGEIQNAEFSNAEYVGVSYINGEWVFSPLRAFDTTESLYVTVDGVAYCIEVTDGKALSAKCWDEVVDDIEDLMGTSYVFGGRSTSGWDCAGFVSYVMHNIYGTSWPGGSWGDSGTDAIVSYCDDYEVARGDSASDYASQVRNGTVKPGDIIVFWHPYGYTVHTAIAGEDGMIYHAYNERYDTCLMDFATVWAWDGGHNKVYANYRVYRGLSELGSLQITKASDNTLLVSGNNCYSVEGAIFGIYKNKSDYNKDSDGMGTAGNHADYVKKTDASGKITLNDLEPGTYWIRELVTPKGYLPYSGSPLSVTVKAGETAKITVKDAPANDPNGVEISKVPGEMPGFDPSKSPSLAGAEYAFDFYGDYYDSAEAAEASGKRLKHWVLRTDENGRAYLDDGDNDGVKVSGDDFYRDASGNIILPLGTLVIYEVNAPEGYQVSPAKYCTRVKLGADGKTYREGDGYANDPQAPLAWVVTAIEYPTNELNPHKVDSETGEGIQGTVFTLDIWTGDGTPVEAGGDDADGTWVEVARADSDANGDAFFDGLSFGWYRLTEIYTNPAYMTPEESGLQGVFYIECCPSNPVCQIQVIENAPIHVETTVDKNTIEVTDIGFIYKDSDGKTVSNVGTGEYRYDVDFTNGNTNTYADEYYVIDECQMTGSPYDLRITKLWTPVVVNDTDGLVWVLIRTNKTDLAAGTAYGMSFAQPDLHGNYNCDGTMRFDVTGWDFLGEYSALARTLIDFGALLPEGEWITGLCLCYGAVEAGFATTSPLSYLVAATHDLEPGTVIPNTATSHITRNLSGVKHTADGDIPVEPRGLIDDDSDSVETTVLDTFDTDFNSKYVGWGNSWYQTGFDALAAAAAMLAAAAAAAVALTVCRRRGEN